MDDQTIKVPVSLLLAQDQPASCKLVWIARRLQPGAGPSQLEALTGLSRHTVLGAAARAETLGVATGGDQVRVPSSLLAAHQLGPYAKLLYGVLQATLRHRGGSGRFTYVSLCAHTGWSRNTIKKAIRQLAGAGWMRTFPSRASRHVAFKLGTPELRRAEAEASRALWRISRAKFEGEAIMQEYLSLLIDSTEYVDNIRPGWLTNPLTGERMELDRLYRRELAFEFHGDQHFQASGEFSKEEVDAQKLRDYIKAGMCLYEDVQVVVVRPDDLTREAMIRKVERYVPVRSLAGRSLLVERLEEAAFDFRNRVEAKRRSNS